MDTPEKGPRMNESDDAGDGAASQAGSTKSRLLHAACELAGGSAALAARLGVSEAMLRKYMSGVFSMPDNLLLRAVDLLLEEREQSAELAPPPAPSTHNRAGA
jgi:hypothetical protein